MKRDFIDMRDYAREEILSIIEEAMRFKSEGYPETCPLKGRVVALVFQKPSTRTRVSFEVAVDRLGGSSLYMNWEELQLGRGEPVADTARVLSRYVDAIVARVYSHETLIETAKFSDKPVVNALSDLFHPCQALADVMTLKEAKGRINGLKIAYVGDGNNVCNSLIQISGKIGLGLTAACPREYGPNETIVEEASEEAERTGGKIEVIEEPREAVRDADAVYTDVFVSMGQEHDRDRRIEVFLPRYQVNSELLGRAKEDAVFMHCLPAHRGEEVTAEVIDGDQSVVWVQAENRLHTEASLLRRLLSDSFR